MHRIPSGARFLSVLLTLVSYHGSFLLHARSHRSSSAPSSFVAGATPPYWLSTLRASLGREEIGGDGEYGSEFGVREGDLFGDNYDEDYDSKSGLEEYKYKHGYGSRNGVEGYGPKRGGSGGFSSKHGAEKYGPKNAAPGYGPRKEFEEDAVGYGSSKRSHTCRPSTNTQRLADMLSMMETLEQLDPENRTQLQARHNLSGVCPPFPPNEFRGLEHQSLCPWTLERNYEADRFPRLLWYARCICGNCSGEDWGDSMRLYSCVPLYHRVAVIKEVCIGGEMHFRWGRESVPVGCVCSHPKTRQID